jgi:hypothetical protein
MTVTIKDSNNNIVGTSEDIFIIINDAKEIFQPLNIGRVEEGNLISANQKGNPIELKEELIMNFDLINPSVDLNKLTEEYTIEATKAHLPIGYVEKKRLTTLIKCKFNGTEGNAQGLFFTNLNN